MALSIVHECSALVRQILTQSGKTCYLTKWQRFLEWSRCHYPSLDTVTIPVVLDYLLAFKTSGLAISSIRVHLAALTAFLPPVEGTSIFTHPTTVCFMKGLLSTFPPVVKLLSPWDLHLVFSALRRLPFEPMATCSMTPPPNERGIPGCCHLGQMSQQAHCHDGRPSLHGASQAKVSLRLHPQILPSVVSKFHLSQSIHLPVFHPNFPPTEPCSLLMFSAPWCSTSTGLDLFRGCRDST